MKATRTIKFTLLAVPFLAAILLVGCATTKPVDWNSRVGNYTYNQAVAELGSPTLQSQTSDGKLSVKWVQPYTAATLNTGMSYYGSAGFAAGQNANRSQVLQLTFDANGVLTAWSKNY